MNKPPFFVSLPRTRSSVLFEIIRPFVLSKMGLLELNTHPEIFLQFSKSDIILNKRTNETYNTEIYPVVNNDNLNIHYIYPHIFNNPIDRNLYKLKILKDLKTKNKNYYIKGTAQIAYTPEQIIDFFSDRHFVITKRKSFTNLILSFLYSWHSGIFHAREHNLDHYKNKLKEGVIVDLHDIHKHMKNIKKMFDIDKYIKSKKYDYSIVYYEDIEDKKNMYDQIDQILDTDEWRSMKGSVPIKLEKNYKESILNYNEVINEINSFRL